MGSWKKDQDKGIILDIADDARAKYVDKIFTFLEVKNLSPLKIIINSGNGAAGPTFDAIRQEAQAIWCANRVCPHPSFAKQQFSKWYSKSIIAPKSCIHCRSCEA